MSSSFEIFDKVKAGKADAMRRYNRKRNLYCFLETVGALVLLWCSFSCFPVITHAASRYLSFFNQKIYAFVLANVFILIVVYLSSTTPSNNDQSDTPIQTDIYDEYVSFSTSSPRWKTTTGEDKQFVVSLLQEEPVQAEEKNPVREKDTLDDEKQIVCCEKSTNDAANVDEMGKNPVRDLTVVKEEKFFRRTLSEKHGKEKREYPREFRRSETEIGRETLTVVRTGGLNYDTPGAARKSMLEMNSDEFRLTIERFIATKKKILREESIALSSEEKEEYLAINYR